MQKIQGMRIQISINLQDWDANVLLQYIYKAIKIMQYNKIIQ